MNNRQFRFGYFTPDYEATVAFYRDGLEGTHLRLAAAKWQAGGASAQRIQSHG